MKYSVIVGRVLLGLVFFVFGLNGFFNFIPVPPMPEKAVTFMTGLMSSHYFLPLLKATEVICGALLLSGFFVPLALVILIIQIFLMVKHCSAYGPLLKAK